MPLVSRTIFSLVIFTLFFNAFSRIKAQTKPRLEGRFSAEESIKKTAMKNKEIDSSIIDIWTWHNDHAFVQGRIISTSAKIIFCAGQTSVDEKGNPINPGDMIAQISKALDNLEAVLAKGRAKLKDVVRMTYYVRDVPAFLNSNPILLKRYTDAGCKPATSLIGVAALFHPDILFEVEATAFIQ